MKTTDLEKFCKQFVLSNGANSLIANHNNLDLYLSELIENRYYSDALLIISYRLSTLNAIRWACKHAKHYLKSPISEQDNNAFSAVTNWLKDPSELNRNNTLPNKIINRPSAGSCLAMAAFWASDNDNPPTELIHDAVYSSLMLSVLQFSEHDQENIYQHAIADGINYLNC